MVTDEQVKYIRLRHPEFAGLQYGAGEDRIIFGARAGQPEFEAWVPENHPLLDQLLEAHPEITVVTAQPNLIYVCPIHPDRRFASEAALKAHFRGKDHDVAALAAALGLTQADDPATDIGPGIHQSRDGVVMQDADRGAAAVRNG